MLFQLQLKAQDTVNERKEVEKETEATTGKNYVIK